MARRFRPQESKLFAFLVDRGQRNTPFTDADVLEATRYAKTAWHTIANKYLDGVWVVSETTSPQTYRVVNSDTLDEEAFAEQTTQVKVHRTEDEWFRALRRLVKEGMQRGYKVQGALARVSRDGSA